MQKYIVRSSLVVGMALITARIATAAPATQPADAEHTAAVQSPETGKLLVLPFHESAAANFGWVGKAIQQDLVADLTHATRAQVEAPSAAVPAQDAAAALEAAKQVGAGWVVYGQFQTVGGQMRITGQVMSVQTGQALGSLTATGPVNDLFPLEDSISGQVLRALPAGVLTIPAPPAPAGAPAQPAMAPAIASPPDPLAASPTNPAASPPTPQYYSYTYPDYSSGPPSTYPNTYLNSPYFYGDPYYWYSIPYYGPDVFFFFGRDHFHHHFHNWGPADRWHQGGIHGFGEVSGHAGGGVSHAPSGRSSAGTHGGGGGGGGGGGHGGGGGGGHR